MRIRIRHLLLAGIGFLSAPLTASAHAFGQQYTLPLPVELYVGGGAAAFALSCVLLALVHRQPASGERAITVPGRFWRPGIALLRAFALFALGAGIIIGFFGQQVVTDNLLLVLFWIGLVLFVPYLSMVIGGFWEVINPFKLAVSLLLPAHAAEKREWRAGYIPALIGYIVLIVLELFFGNYAAMPAVIAGALLLYTLMLLVGSARYGIETWFRVADFFALFFRFASMLAPITIGKRKISVAAPVRRLVDAAVSDFSLSLFIIFALAATAYDGLRESALLAAIAPTQPLLTSLIVFILMPLLFFGLFAAALFVMRKIAADPRPLSWHIKRFTVSLIPIVFAYHFAHYFSLLVSTGFSVLALASDPFGIGWDLFGTADFPTTALIGADTVWYIQLVVIVLGHAFAAYIAHLVALREFGSRKRALASQLPLAVLMVFFTAFGLWVLAQPFML